jgi:mRNA interferase HigB
VHVITRKRLAEFAQQHPACASALDHWYRVVRHGSFSSLADIRRVLPSADQVGRFTVFNIGGDKVRLIAAIHYNRSKLYIRQVLTHAEYDREHWKD